MLSGCTSSSIRRSSTTIHAMTAAQRNSLFAENADAVVVDRYLRAIDAPLGWGGDAGFRQLEEAFVAVAHAFSERCGIGYETWCDVGVSEDVLRRAGVDRSLVG